MARVELIGDNLEAKHLDITGKKAIQRIEKTTHVLDWFRFERERLPLRVDLAIRPASPFDERRDP